MAGTITHYIMAVKYLKETSFSDDYKRGFLFGTHGPDFCFLGPTKDSYHLGQEIHKRNAKYLFNDFDKLEGKSDLYMGYAYGVLYHYFIDRLVHQYVTRMTSLNGSTAFHGKIEKEFDMILYKEYFNEPVNNLRFKEIYKLDSNIIDTIYEFYKDNSDYQEFTKDYLYKAFKKFNSRITLTLKANPIIIFISRLLEIKNKNPYGTNVYHFFKDESTLNMNRDHKEWDSLRGKVNYSVDDLLDLGFKEYKEEVDKIKIAKATNTKYSFDYHETFEGSLD